MPMTMACIVGTEIQRQIESGRLAVQRLGRRATPFGDSGELFQCNDGPTGFYLLVRHGAGLAKPAPWKINDRANLYALKDVGAQCVLSWGPGGAVTHNFAVGDLVILSDLIDRTRQRPRTFFENSPLGYLRQFPVFCPTLRRVAGEALHGLRLSYHGAAAAAVSEGPRLETPAEVRMLATAGAEIVTHHFAPEAFLAKELQLCYAAVCYVVNYAETGSCHRPFSAGDLFGGLTQQSDGQRLAAVLAAMGTVNRQIAAALAAASGACECDKTQAANIQAYGLNSDWRTWFKTEQRS